MSLEDRLEQGLPSAWRPDQDDPATLVGQVISIDVGESDYGRYPIIVVRKEDGEEKTVHGFHSVLQSELMKKRPQIGEKVGLKFLGDVPGATRSYKGYRVEVEREHGASFDWNAIGAPADEDSIGRVVYDEIKEPASDSVTVPAGAGDDDLPF